MFRSGFVPQRHLRAMNLPPGTRIYPPAPPPVLLPPGTRRLYQPFPLRQPPAYQLPTPDYEDNSGIGYDGGRIGYDGGGMGYGGDGGMGYQRPPRMTYHQRAQERRGYGRPPPPRQDDCCC